MTSEPAGHRPAPLVVAPLMGYGHLRAAMSTAEALGIEMRRSDRPPLCAPSEVRTWEKVRRAYEGLSRLSQRRMAGAPAHRFLEWITTIPPLHPERDLSAPTRSAHTLERFVAQGFGRTLARRVLDRDETLVSTFYAGPIAADRMGCRRVACIVTDSDVNRVWAPLRPGRTTIRYLVPTRRVARRLRSYGVPEDAIEHTGFPLPPALLGEDLGLLRRNLAARLARLDPQGALRGRLSENALTGLLPRPRSAPSRAPHVVFAVGGAGAQTDLVPRFLPGIAPLLRDDRLRLTLVAGTRREVANDLRRAVQEAGVADRLGHGLEVLYRPDVPTYYAAFNSVLAEADVLWTKPGELVFYAALGLPLVLSPAVGVQERENEAWVSARGAALAQGDPRHAASWLMEWLEDGVLAGAAWSGYVRLPHQGAWKIRDAVRSLNA